MDGDHRAARSARADGAWCGDASASVASITAKDESVQRRLPSSIETSAARLRFAIQKRGLRFPRTRFDATPLRPRVHPTAIRQTVTGTSWRRRCQHSPLGFLRRKRLGCSARETRAVYNRETSFKMARVAKRTVRGGRGGLDGRRALVDSGRTDDERASCCRDRVAVVAWAWCILGRAAMIRPSRHRTSC